MLNSKVDPFNNRIQRAIPNLTVHDAVGAIEFYKKLFDAKVKMIANYNGKIAHSEVIIANTSFFISDEIYGDKSAKTIGSSPVSFYIYVANVDEIFNKALQLGAKVVQPISDMFYGDRIGSFIDQFGFTWMVASHIKEVSQEESNKGLQQMMKQMEQTHQMQQSGGANDTYKNKYLKYKKKYQDLRN